MKAKMFWDDMDNKGYAWNFTLYPESEYENGLLVEVPDELYEEYKKAYKAYDDVQTQLFKIRKEALKKKGGEQL